jgi:(p)ppGpp synthase/HD superfamily hydrolase
MAKMTETERIAKLEQFARETTDHYWRFQGRLNAHELVLTVGTLNFAKMQREPFKFIQDYVAAMRSTSSNLVPEVDDATKADRLISETKNAIDDFLAELLRSAGQLKGAPGNR